MQSYTIRHMTEEEATAFITDAVQPSASPTLSSTEMAALVELAKDIDEYGVTPYEEDGTDNTNWNETWNMNRAINKGWKMKAAKAAASYDLSDASLRMQRSQVMKACLDMAKLYPVCESIQTPPAAQVYDPVYLNRFEPVD